MNAQNRNLSVLKSEVIANCTPAKINAVRVSQRVSAHLRLTKTLERMANMSKTITNGDLKIELGFIPDDAKVLVSLKCAETR